MQTLRPERIRTACDSCHKSKMKCSRGNPCDACARSGHRCLYSPPNRLGRPPKGQTRKGKVSTASSAADAKRKYQSLDRLTSANPQHVAVKDDPLVEGSLTLDDMFMDACSEPLPIRQVFPLGGDTADAPYFACGVADYILLPIQTGSQPWSQILGQLSEPLIDLESFNTSHSSPQSAIGDSIFLPQQVQDRCHCLQQHSRFLCDLKNLDPDNHSFTLDVAREFLQLWQHHLGCTSCWNEEDKSALILSITSLTGVIKRLWRLIDNFQLQASSQDSSISDGSLFPAVIPKVSVPAINSRELLTEVSGSARRNSVALSAVAPAFNIGGLRVPEEEQGAVAIMLIMRIIRRIRKGLGELRKKESQVVREEKSGEQVFLFLSTFGLVAVESLEDSVEDLEESLEILLLDLKETS
ncbi:hypothetical protein F5Y19DRAFT_483971 [Xylariaceae sp. FL1651]|nr:hypothetical protein F5Y19DRAFT_483971 [Xylariaceae sp. FL1651]